MYEFNLSHGMPIAQIKGRKCKFNNEILYIGTIKKSTKKKTVRGGAKKYEESESYDESRSDEESRSLSNENSQESESFSDDESKSSLSEVDTETDSEEENILTDVIFDGCELIPLPSENGRRVSYITGKSGSGKSTYAAKYIEKYKKMFPDREIYVFSRKPKDPVLDKIGINRIVVDESIIDDPIDITQDIDGPCCILFDDASTYPNEKIQKAVLKLMMDVMEIGRSYEVEVIITNHLPTAKEKNLNRTIFNESQYITLFPRMTNNKRMINYTLSEYLGLDNDLIKRIHNLKSRWVTIHNECPGFVLYDHGAFLI